GPGFDDARQGRPQSSPHRQGHAPDRRSRDSGRGRAAAGVADLAAGHEGLFAHGRHPGRLLARQHVRRRAVLPGFAIVALLVVGIMALRYRRIARGAASAIVPVAGYIGYYSVAPLLPYLSFDAIFSHGLAALTYAASLSTVLAAILVLALLSLRDPDDEPETD